jgi:hypothetical protein
MQSISLCGRFCTGNDIEPQGVDSSSDIPISASRFFAQRNVHDIPGEKLNGLSAQERSEAFHDLHGVSSPPVKETPDLVAEKLEELDQQMFLVEDRRAFELAQEINPDYVRSLRQRFLRAENYEVEAAAERFAKNFAFRLDMFGEHVLGRDILLTDLSEADRTLLNTGYMQVTKGRDRAGRSFSVQIMRHLGKEPSPHSAVRCESHVMSYSPRSHPWTSNVSTNVRCIYDIRRASISFLCSTWEIKSTANETVFCVASTWSVSK